MTSSQISPNLLSHGASYQRRVSLEVVLLLVDCAEIVSWLPREFC